MTTLGQVCRFGCVGAAAAAIHWMAVTLLVPHGMAPLLANVAGFAIAFQASYFGHRAFTFQTSGGKGSYLRMLVVSFGAFVLNEGLYAVLLAFTPLDYRVALLIVLLAVAAGTFVASRLWVFARHAEAS